MAEVQVVVPEMDEAQKTGSTSVETTEAKQETPATTSAPEVVAPGTGGITAPEPTDPEAETTANGESAAVNADAAPAQSTEPTASATNGATETTTPAAPTDAAKTNGAEETTASAPELPKTYKGAVYDQPGKISTKIVDLEMPEPGPGEVLINLTHSGVCHSDLGVMTNTWKALPFPTPSGQVGGHEGVGKIVKLGAGADTAGVKLGDRVGIKWMAGTCGNCQACLAGHDASCFSGKVSGYFTPGTFQQYVLSPANYVTPIPEGLDPAAAAPMLCAGVTVYSALRKAVAMGAEAGTQIAIVGAGGGLGHLAVQIASRGMAMRVIGVDADNKKDLVLASGAEHFIGLSEGDTAKAVLDLTGGVGVQAAVVVTAANAAYATAVNMIKFGGTVVCVGIPEGELQPIATAFPSIIVAKSLNIVGSAVGNRKEAIDCLEMAARGVVKTHYRTEKLEKLTEVFEDMHAMKLQGRVVIDLQS